MLRSDHNKVYVNASILKLFRTNIENKKDRILRRFPLINHQYSLVSSCSTNVKYTLVFHVK